jgi:hypothetical protein
LSGAREWRKTSRPAELSGALCGASGITSALLSDAAAALLVICFFRPRLRGCAALRTFGGGLSSTMLATD